MGLGAPGRAQRARAYLPRRQSRPRGERAGGGPADQPPATVAAAQPRGAADRRGGRVRAGAPPIRPGKPGNPEGDAAAATGHLAPARRPGGRHARPAGGALPAVEPGGAAGRRHPGGAQRPAGDVAGQRPARGRVPAGPGRSGPQRGLQPRRPDPGFGQPDGPGPAVGRRAADSAGPARRRAPGRGPGPGVQPGPPDPGLRRLRREGRPVGCGRRAGSGRPARRRRRSPPGSGVSRSVPTAGRWPPARR